MPLIVRKGDTGTHGGQVGTGASRWRCEGAPIARVGDIYLCPEHGPNPIETGSTKWRCEGAPIARHGDVTACGAVLISGAQRWQCD
ncbi:putative Zn-binding protein involved in type VI secretion [Microvirga flocculans]|uniref:Putative Zn-binding protein involved in type VI secretion n=1 Tax=Microvirga flocculans TaxID=217168 RepID=A0A7W6NA04_9HYPH|nr:PAAR domain-containing protein [Microvirga flocculans]MBB4042015.1 putative Zn-binding protein involved in type VI secretion [Microvirga flocculans]